MGFPQKQPIVKAFLRAWEIKEQRARVSNFRPSCPTTGLQ